MPFGRSSTASAASDPIIQLTVAPTGSLNYYGQGLPLLPSRLPVAGLTPSAACAVALPDQMYDDIEEDEEHQFFTVANRRTANMGQPQVFQKRFHDVPLQRLVVFAPNLLIVSCSDDGGLAGEDGPLYLRIADGKEV